GLPDDLELSEHVHPLLPLGEEEVLLEVANEVGGGAVVEEIVAQLDDAHCLPSHSTRVWTMIQFFSQVWPSSGEKSCSQRADVLVMFDHVKRTRIGRPSSAWGPSKTPTPFTNDPITGGSTVPIWLLAQ